MAPVVVSFRLRVPRQGLAVPRPGFLEQDLVQGVLLVVEVFLVFDRSTGKIGLEVVSLDCILDIVA